MPHLTNPGHIIPQDIEPGDTSEAFGIAEPYTQTEIEDLLYGDDRPASQRLARLRELREESVVRESGDWGDQDPKQTIDELDRAIDELSATIANTSDLEDFAGLAPTFDLDPSTRLDALSPDDVEAREAIEGFAEEEAEGDGEAEDMGPLDVAEWEEGDGFDPDKGVH
jgi:hypothetical protein